MRKLLATILLFLTCALFSAAQITQTGTLNGTVYDLEKQPLPGVSVTIKSPALILPQMVAVTTERGHFRFPALPPGEYTVTFKLPGFKTLIREDIRVRVGVTITLDVGLEQTTIEESIVVTGQSPTVDIQRTSMSVNLTKEILQSLPATRSLGTYFNLAPGVTSSTVHGSSERDNTYNIDGVNVTDPVTGTQAGSFSIDIIEELSIQTGGLPAEYGSVRGGVVNVVTKSGSNKFSGSVSGYFRKKNLQSVNNKGTIFEGQVGGFNYETEPSITLGGPLIKDKIWVFLTGTYRGREEFVLGYPWDQSDNVPLDYAYYMPFGKITWQLTERDRVVLSFNYYDYIRHHRGASTTQNVDSTWNQTTPIYTYNFQLAHFFNPNLYMNLKASYMNYHLNLSAKNDKVREYDRFISKYSQSYGYDDIYSRDRFQAMTDATYFIDDWLGRHEIKAGVEFEYSFDSRYRRHNLDEYELGPFFYFRTNIIPVYPATRSDTYMTYYQDFTRKDRKIVIGGYFQDAWSLSSRLTLNIGLRFDHQEGIIPKQGLEREPVIYRGETYDPRVTESFKPIIWNTLAPRLGAVFDVTGDGKTAFKINFSRYYIANILQWFVTVNPNSFISWRTRYTTDPDTGEWRPVDPTSSYYMTNFSATANATMDPDLKSPYLDEFVIGLERELMKDIRIGVRYIRKWDRNLIEDVDLNAFNLDLWKTGQYDILDPILWPNYELKTVNDPWYDQPVTFWDLKDSSVPWNGVITNPPGAQRDYDGIEVTFDKRFSNRWSMSSSFVWQKSRGLIPTDFDASWSGEAYFDSPNAHVNAIGRFPYEREYQVKIQGMWQGPWGILISGYYRYLEGQRWTRIVRASDLELTLNQGDTSNFAETLGSRKEDALSLCDLRFAKSFNLPGKVGNIDLFVDIFNVFNVAIPTSVWSRSSSTTTINNMIVRFGDLTAITAPRVFRLGFRYQF